MDQKSEIIDFLKHYKKDIENVKITIEGDEVSITFTAVEEVKQ